MMGKLFLIGLAGFIGTLARYGLSGVIAKRYGETFPLGTLAVNLIGCFLVGLLFYLMQERFLVNQNVRTIILNGLLGGFTTFSSLGLQTFTLLQDGEFGLAAANLGVSNLIGLFMVWAGFTLARVL
ncbi:MAG TPA: fluoride efflux transporter CrcB [Pyrinomonadaceae bacterium]|nr:fluoride efflux transporter CrcB [Pyrinomonadaceae bacterium]